jgi:hypothetical protein
MFKTISMTAVSAALIFGTLAASPASTAFAKSYFVKQRTANVTEHRRGVLVYDQGPKRGLITKAYHMGNRSISFFK